MRYSSSSSLKCVSSSSSYPEASTGASSRGSMETTSRSRPHSSHCKVSPSSISSTSRSIGLSHSGHTTAIFSPPEFQVRSPPYWTHERCWRALPVYLFSGHFFYSSSLPAALVRLLLSSISLRSFAQKPPPRIRDEIEADTYGPYRSHLAGSAAFRGRNPPPYLCQPHRLFRLRPAGLGCAQAHCAFAGPPGAGAGSRLPRRNLAADYLRLSAHGDSGHAVRHADAVVHRR